ncbi:MAG: hypothetical protein V3S55_13820, partial [Nitrospiraceae bacterium]
MRRVFMSAIVLLLAAPLWADNSVLTGTFEIPTGSRFNGSITLQLSHLATDAGVAVAPAPVTFRIRNGTFVGQAVVKDNTTLSPTGTFYKATFRNRFGGIIARSNYVVSSDPFDMGAAPMTQITTSQVGYLLPLLGNDVVACNPTTEKMHYDPATDIWSCPADGGVGAGATHQIDATPLSSSNPINFLDTSEFDWTNPAAGNLSLALNSASVADSRLVEDYSGVGNCAADNFVTGVVDNFAPNCAQPSFSNLSGSATDAQIPNTITLDNITQITTRSITSLSGIAGRGQLPSAIAYEDEANVFAASTTRFDNDANAALSIQLDAGNTTAQIVDILFQDRGATRWFFRKAVDDSFSLIESSFGTPRFQFPIGINLADVGVLRFGNAEILAWESSPAGTDLTFTVNSSEVFVMSGPLDVATGYTIGGVAASGNVLRGSGTRFVSAQLNFSDLAGTATQAQIGANSVGASEL